jgi:hypothetical protein
MSAREDRPLEFKVEGNGATTASAPYPSLAVSAQTSFDEDALALWLVGCVTSLHG